MSSHQQQLIALFRQSLSYWLLGGMRLHRGHVPPVGHLVPENFMGVCVASNENPETDDYLINVLKSLGLRRVRIDFSYDDENSYQARFLDRLIQEEFDITLHVVQPFEAASQMHLRQEQVKWADFLQRVLERYGQQIQEIELGSTINRKRWAGYTLDGFYLAWKIGVSVVRERRIPLVGPNIQDFEPIYNIAVLKHLAQQDTLPDIFSNNLFVERVSEPERFDHRILKYRWSTILKYNVVKKARILHKICQDFGVQHLMSSVAFWAVYRIKRILPEGEQKQADYAARYFLLMAASGAVLHANWGALVCQREGLITDGLLEKDYPDLERVARYRRADGELRHYLKYPSFDAVKTVAAMIQGSRYLGPIATSQGLEIHRFQREDTWIHALWTINGKAMLLSSIYPSETLQSAQCIDRDGQVVKNVSLVTESPLYLHWNTEQEMPWFTPLSEQPDLVIHAHQHGKHYWPIDQAGWRGLILASNEEEAASLFQSLHPDTLVKPRKEGALRLARNAIWTVDDPREHSRKLTIKQPVKMHLHKRILDRFKPSKAKRSWDGAMELMRRGIGTAAPVAYFEKINDPVLCSNYYICEYVQADFNIGQAFLAYSQGELSYKGVASEALYTQFAAFSHLMHRRGIYFRDFSAGNILVTLQENGHLQFSLIDTARIHAYSYPIPMHLRIADLTRAMHKLYWPGRERCMQIYLGMTGRTFGMQYRLPFYRYDFKVKLKKSIGRKAWKRWKKLVFQR